MLATGLHSREQGSTWSCLGCRLIGTTIIGIAGVLAQQLSDSGSSTVRASGGDSG